MIKEVEEFIEMRTHAQIAREKAFLKLLSVIHRDYRNKLQDVVRYLYENHSIDGILMREELFKRNREQKIKKDIEQIHEETRRKEKTLVESELKQGMKVEYTYTFFLLSTLGFERATAKKVKLPTDKLNGMLSDKWSGENVSEINKKHKAEFTGKTFNSIVFMANQNKPLKEGLKDITKLSESKTKKTMTFFTTEMTKKRNDVSSLLYDDYVKNKEIEWCAALDKRTCRYCANFDGKVFRKGTEPECPAHPRCRCTLVPYFDEETVRRARDPHTNKNYLTSKQTYNEWRKEVGI